jgi:outer membrane immunogenic protein
VSVAFVCFTFACIMGAVTPAHAQAYDWTGIYAGINIGGGWYHSNAAVAAACPANGYFCNATAGATNAVAIDTLASVANSGSSFTGGGQAGYNYQFKYLVFTAEGDFDYLYLHGTKQFASVYPAGLPSGASAGTKLNIATSVSTDWVGLFRGHLGWAGIPGILLFVDGGLAVSDLKGQSVFADSAGASENASGVSHVGWTAGTGFDIPITRNWMVRAEYFYLDLGSITVNGTVANPKFPALSNPLTTTETLTAHVLRLGANYRF